MWTHCVTGCNIDVIGRELSELDDWQQVAGVSRSVKQDMQDVTLVLPRATQPYRGRLHRNVYVAVTLSPAKLGLHDCVKGHT